MALTDSHGFHDSIYVKHWANGRFQYDIPSQNTSTPSSLDPQVGTLLYIKLSPLLCVYPHTPQYWYAASIFDTFVAICLFHPHHQYGLHFPFVHLLTTNMCMLSHFFFRTFEVELSLLVVVLHVPFLSNPIVFWAFLVFVSFPAPICGFYLFLERSGLMVDIWTHSFRVNVAIWAWKESR